MSTKIHPVHMPKWGISMTEGRIAQWLVAEGTPVRAGEEIVEVETEKILSSVETREAGVVRRHVAREGEVLLVGALLAVLAGPEVADSEIDRFVEDFQVGFGAEKTSEAISDEATETVQVGDRNIQFLRSGGNGQPLILVHGFGGSLNNWLFNREALATVHEVVALDLPGHGGSSKDVGSGSISELAEVLSGFLDALQIRRAHLVGHSLGGAIAASLALQEPERIESLTLIASVGLGAEINAAYLEGFVKARKRRDLKKEVIKLVHDPALVSRRMLEDILRFKRLDGVEEALQTIADQLVSGGLQRVLLGERIQDLAVPRLVIWGEEDQVIPCSQAPPGDGENQTAVLPGAGHLVQMEAAGEVNRLILEHVAAASG